MTLTPASIVLPADALRDALRACRPAVSSDDTRPTLAAVRVSAAAGIVWIDATDGHRLHTVSVSMTDAARDASISLSPAGVDTAIRVLAEVLREAKPACAAAEKAHARAKRAYAGPAKNEPVLRLPVPLVALDASGGLTVNGTLRGVAPVARDADIPKRDVLDRVAELTGANPVARIGFDAKYLTEALDAVALFSATRASIVEIRGDFDPVRVSAADDLRRYTHDGREGSAVLSYRATVMPMRL
jgi:hypothetical protein